MKDYIRDDGEVRLCDSNIAKMNVFELMYYHRHRTMGDVIECAKEFLPALVNMATIIILPVVYPIFCYRRILSARKEVERCRGRD